MNGYICGGIKSPSFVNTNNAHLDLLPATLLPAIRLFYRAVGEKVMAKIAIFFI